MSNEQKLREALRRIKSEAVSLADAQVLALEALALPITPPAAAPAPAVPDPADIDRQQLREACARFVDENRKASIAAHEAKAAPAVPQGEPVSDEWICEMAKRYAGTIVERHGHSAFLFTLAELLAFIAALRGKQGGV